MFYSLQAVAGLLPVFLLWLLLIRCGLMLERIRPVCGLPSRAAIFNVAYMTAFLLIQGVNLKVK
jgi:hypothetical protein